MRVTVVIPTYNEKENISKLIPEIFSCFDRYMIDGNVIVVDDNSPDGTSNVVKDMGKRFDVSLITREKKMGIGSAYIEGFKRALAEGSDVIFEMDGDMSHDPSDIQKFLAKIESGYGLVIGSRTSEGGSIVGWGAVRKMISLGGNIVGRIIAGIDVPDLTSGYRAYRKDVLEKIDFDNLNSKSYDFQLEMIYSVSKTGFKVGTVPITFTDRKVGRSKLSKLDILGFFLTAVRIRLDD